MEATVQQDYGLGSREAPAASIEFVLLCEDRDTHALRISELPFRPVVPVSNAIANWEVNSTRIGICSKSWLWTYWALHCFSMANAWVEGTQEPRF
jgi:hypothetical protein